MESFLVEIGAEQKLIDYYRQGKYVHRNIVSKIAQSEPPATGLSREEIKKIFTYIVPKISQGFACG